MNHNPELESSLAAFRADAEKGSDLLAPSGLIPLISYSYNYCTPTELVQEASIRVLQRAVLRQRMEHRTLRTLVDRVQEECRRLVGEKEVLEAAQADLRRELLRVSEEASRLRAAAEHAQGFLRWGLDADKG